MKTTTSDTYREHKINTGGDNSLPCSTKTLDQIIDRCEYMISKHSKVHMTRIDIRTDAEVNEPIRAHISRIMDDTKRAVKANHNKNPHNRNAVDMHYVWAGEQSKRSKREHIHVVIFINGNAIQNCFAISEPLTDAVCKHLKSSKRGLVERCESTGKKGLMIDRNSADFQEQMNKAVYIANYLAKTHTKENKAKHKRISSASRLPPK